MLTETAIAWLELRGLDPEIAMRYGVESFANASGEEHIGFAYMLHGEHVNTKRRSLTEKRFWMDEGGTLCLWNANTLNDRALAKLTPLIITEGECDALTAIQCGFPHSVSIPNGAPAADAGEAEKRYQWLDIHTGLIDHASIILATDSDGPGARLRRDLEVRLGRERCRWLRYPKGCKDLSDVLLQHGQEAVVQLITTAPWSQLPGLYLANELPPEPNHDVLSTGMPGLDQFLKIRVGELTVVSGTPNVGKTEWVCSLACSMAAKHQMRVAIGSFEDMPRASLLPRLRRWRDGHDRDFGMFQGESADDWIQNRFAFISPPSDSEEISSLFWLVDRMKAAVIRHETRLIIIDPWNEIEHEKPDSMPMTDYVGQALRALKSFARNYDVHIVIVAHPSKGGASKAKENGELSAYDIADSAHWANKPDNIILLSRDRNTDITKVHVSKIRHQHAIGKPGTAHMKYNPDIGRFEGAANPNEL